MLFLLSLGFEFCITLFLHRFDSELVNLNVFERAVHTGLHLTLYCSFFISMKGGFSPTLKSSLKHEWLLLFAPPITKWFLYNKITLKCYWIPEQWLQWSSQLYFNDAKVVSSLKLSRLKLQFNDERDLIFRIIKFNLLLSTEYSVSSGSLSDTGESKETYFLHHFKMTTSPFSLTTHAAFILEV